MAEIFLLTDEILLNLGKDKLENPLAQVAYSIAVFKDAIYLAATYHEEGEESYDWMRVQRYNPKTGTWEEMYRALLNNGASHSSAQNLLKDKYHQKNSDEQEIYDGLFPKALHSETIVFKGNSDVNPTLYISAVSPFGSCLLRAQNGILFEDIYAKTVVEGNIEGLNNLSFWQIVAFQNRLYALISGQIKDREIGDRYLTFLGISDDPASGKWKFINFEGSNDPHNQAISNIAVFNDCLYVGTLNPNGGCQIWKTKEINNIENNYSWQIILPKGTYRYALNQLVLSMVTFKDVLYMATGNAYFSKRKIREKQLHSFELICIYPNDNWDIIVGTPRFTPDGLKVPLSAMGPGFDKLFNCFFQCMTAHKGNLYTLTQAPDGFQVLMTENAETWQPVSLQDLSDNLQTGIQTFISTSLGLILIATPEIIPNVSKITDEESHDTAVENDSYSIITGVATNISSSTKQIGVHLHQENMWMTDDAVIHAAFHLGEREETGTWEIFSSFDEGVNWNQITPLKSTNARSTCDCIFYQNTIYVAYSDLSGKIALDRFAYDRNSRNWHFIETNIVNEDTRSVVSLPTLTIDRYNRIWCTFIRRDRLTKRIDIRVFYSNDSGISWNDTTQSFGTPNVSSAKSARILALSDRVGLVYTNEYFDSENNTIRTRNWAYRMNDWLPTEEWRSQLLYQHKSQKDLKENRFGSHFSAVVDGLENIHVALQDKGKLLYLRYDGKTQGWSEPKFLSDDYKVSYVQTSISGDRSIFIACNMLSAVGIFESGDCGKNFHLSKLLLHPSDLEGDFTHPRIKTPLAIQGYLIVLQQFKTDELCKLICFKIAE